MPVTNDTGERTLLVLFDHECGRWSVSEGGILREGGPDGEVPDEVALLALVNLPRGVDFMTCSCLEGWRPLGTISGSSRTSAIALRSLARQLSMALTGLLTHIRPQSMSSA